MNKGIAVVSGGLDSTTMVYHLLAEGNELDLVSFNYGQRHAKELQFASTIAKQLGLHHDIVDLTGITHLISNSALTSQTGLTVRGQNFDGEGFHPNIEVPDGHYAEETMKATVVPNRNMIMLALASGIAVNRKAQFVATAVHSGDHFIYPDCRPAFIEALSTAVWVGNEGFGAFGYRDECITAPFLHWSKMEIAFRAITLNVPLHLTWSCYKGGLNHCGRCGTCVERLEAISDATDHINNTYEHKHTVKDIDHTVYDDEEFWKTAKAPKAAK
jgi:7-cyano-7-deazaguanine synthase